MNHPGLRKRRRQITDCAADVGQELVCRAGEGMRPSSFKHLWVGDGQDPPFAGDKGILRGGRELSKVSEAALLQTQAHARCSGKVG